MRRFKFTAAILVLSALLMTLTGCMPKIPDVRWDDLDASKLKGKGEIITQTISVDDYQKINIDANMEVIYSAEKSDVIEVTGYENLLAELDVTVKNGTLVIRSEREFVMGPDNRDVPKIKIGTSSLEKVLIEGAVIWKEGDPLAGENLQLDILGVCDMDVTVDVNTLTVNLAGVGDVALAGQAEKANFTSAGVGNLKAFPLEVADMRIGLSGVGNMEVYCTETLDISLSGMGNITYRGDAQVSKNILGAGMVQKQER